MSVAVYLQGLKSGAGVSGDVLNLLEQIEDLHSKKLAHHILSVNYKDKYSGYLLIMYHIESCVLCRTLYSICKGDTVTYTF